ncbi:Uncharacterized conserved protein YtfP, gamma-glutamylcyclotransferase (GGCT)/AIG2-like family [Mucilaginibacter mallensis]|uniref:Uncharacterized conserved protein YtfP, gamma-glutamylcyclotransferase (GGCT)/AIG2-like family n=1 Tax=Mucilaginibacter mallensis TaxID=652787 RepID=A0A1H1XKU1_MUCMA|nr:gamma-glutamylcyclotransferase family protein [Mucilaginibacter mallensis]SDT09783.1 Uncharacterized conserved protein YtfP, gamma-glutamylcyclotransferase (GGCT)/AIG2-like family [Mucilaginibacter mallensis]
MKQTGNYLFVYGTLLNAGNSFATYLTNNCNFYGKGKLKGRLYDIGEYPGAVADSNSRSYIYGDIVLIHNPTVLKQLDDYEGFGDDQQQPNLFIREMMEIETAEGSIDCWVYLYNLPVEGLVLIESGDYLKYRS